MDKNCMDIKYTEQYLKGEEVEDNINHPKHYEGSIECIDAMEQSIGTSGVINFCIGNAFKYIWRCNRKNDRPTEDLKKARWYINKALELLDVIYLNYDK